MDIDTHMTRSRALVAFALLTALTVMGCSDGPTRPRRDQVTPAMSLSDTSIASRGATVLGNQATAAASISETEVTYVALSPATVPNGVAAVIRNRRTGGMAAATVVDGGFDPVPIGARLGDTVVTTVSFDDNRQSTVLTNVVPAKRRPSVVRTIPPRGKKDVPLNSRITIVFSEPIDPSSVGSETIHLVTGADQVAGQVTTTAGGLAAEFAADGPLSSETDYALTISTGVTDRDGEALESAYVTSFRTGSAVSLDTAVYVNVEPGAAGIVEGSTISLVARTFRRIGESSEEIFGRALRWYSTDPSTLTVDSGGRVTAIRSGATSVVVTVEGDDDPAAVIPVTAVPVTPLDFDSLAIGFDHTCALTTAGRAYCWGANGAGELGNGGESSVAPVAVQGDLTFVSIGAGYGFSCGLTTDGVAYCWGQSKANQLGQPNADAAGELCGYWDWLDGPGQWPCSRRPLAVVGVPPLQVLAVGLNNACGLDASGSAYCWGANNRRPSSPYLVQGGLSFATISAAAHGTCALTTAGKPYCWGYGNDLPSAWNTHLGEIKFKSIGVGSLHMCTLTPSGAAYCSGSNSAGQLGDGSFASSGGWVTGNHVFVNLTAGESYNCAVTATGEAFCWGSGALGAPVADAQQRQPTPTLVEGGLRFVNIAAGSAHTCGRSIDASVYCWGQNESLDGDGGKIGDGTLDRRPTPVRVFGQR